jgi:branched-chain amino acid transport system substrate-binding protein
VRRSRLPLAALIAISSLAAACAPSAAIIIPPTGSPITVGAVLSLTGSQATNGQMAKEGYLYCQDWINGKGGINVKAVSHRLSLDIADDQSRPSIAASTTEHLISENHDTLLLGPSSDATASRAAPVAEQHQVPMVSSGASSDAIFNNQYHYLFSVLAPRSRQLQGMIDMALAQDPKPQSVAILFASDSLSAEVAAATAAYAQAQQMNIQPKLFGFSDGPGAARFTTDLRKAANFTVGATQWAPAARNLTSYFLDSFHYALAFAAQFGHMPDQHAAAATAACLTLEVAIERAASTEPAKVREALAATDLNTFFGPIKFDDRGANAVKPVYVQQVQSGRAVLIWPPDVASARPRYPDPGWAKR